MEAKELIRKTRDGEPLAIPEIEYLVRGAVSGEVASYQLTAWMMAAFLRGLSREETLALARAMLGTGRRLSFANLGHRGARGAEIPGARAPENAPGARMAANLLAADKHSTGGVGDKISFLVAPLVAAAGVAVPMISGRSLGHTGGTLDKLESIPGVRTSLDAETFARTVEEVGFCIAGQSEELAPADRILYKLRDASSIVESIPLITASILSKKAAAGVQALALDVKIGDGAFMPQIESGRALAASLIETASALGIRARAHLTRMDRVLGRTAGNALEIAEAVRVLRGERVSSDLRELTLALGASMLELSGAARTRADARELLERQWRSGAGYDRFQRMVERLGGDPRVLDNPALLPRAAERLEVGAPSGGVFLGVRARAAGVWIMEAGGGRRRADDPVDPRVGIEILCAPGSEVDAGTPVLLLHLPPAAAPAELARLAAGWVMMGEKGAQPGSVLGETLDQASAP